VVTCLKSIAAQTRLPDEVIIVDASDQEEMYDHLQSYSAGHSLKLCYFKSEPGLTHQRNIGVKVSSGDVVLFLDDDVILEKEYVSRILDVFESDRRQEVGGATGCITNITKPSLVGLGRERLRWFIKNLFFLPIYADGRFRPSGFPTWVWGAERVLEIECLSGSNMAFRKEVLDTFQFDENLQGYCYMEDDDIAYRMSRRFRNIYTPWARLAHFPSGRDRLKEFDRKRMLVKNHSYLFQKNFPQTLQHRVAFVISLLGLVLDAVLCKNLEGLKGTIGGLRHVFKKE
jgi:GT2 family glycosyltransferase